MPYSWQGVAGDVVVTAYVAWSLAEAGFTGAPLGKALAWLEANRAAAPGAYAGALYANAAADPAALVEGESGETLYFAKGGAAEIETTALSALAMMKSTEYAERVNAALESLVKAKDGRGTWGSTSATILALKALIRGLGGIEQKETVTLSIGPR